MCVYIYIYVCIYVCIYIYIYIYIFSYCLTKTAIAVHCKDDPSNAVYENNLCLLLEI